MEENDELDDKTFEKLDHIIDRMKVGDTAVIEMGSKNVTIEIIEIELLTGVN